MKGSGNGVTRGVTRLKGLNWNVYSQFSFLERMPYWQKQGRLFHVISSLQFDKDFLEHMYALMRRIRSLSQKKEGKRWLMGLLRECKVLLYFLQPSTRTFFSFKVACESLGMHVSDLKDMNVSSSVKGESFDDTIRTVASYFDMVVMRSAKAYEMERTAYLLSGMQEPISLVDAGSGIWEHPTQALLDMFTLQEAFEKHGGFERKTILLVGDLIRSRAVKSLCYALGRYKGVGLKLIFVSPKAFSMTEDTKLFLEKHGIDCKETEDLKSVLGEADAIYMTRLQDEYDEVYGPSLEIQFHYEKEAYRLHLDDLELLKPSCCILHPLPRRGEIDERIDKDKRALYWKQVQNGVWARMALIAYLFKVDEKVLEK